MAIDPAWVLKEVQFVTPWKVAGIPYTGATTDTEQGSKLADEAGKRKLYRDERFLFGATLTADNGYVHVVQGGIAFSVPESNLVGLRKA